MNFNIIKNFYRILDAKLNLINMKIKQYLGAFMLILSFNVVWAQRPITNRVEYKKSEPAVYSLPEGVNSMGIDIQMDDQEWFLMPFMDVKKAIYEAVELPIAQEVYGIDGNIHDALGLIISIKIGSCKTPNSRNMKSESGASYTIGALTFPMSISWNYKNHPNDNFTKEFNNYSEDGQYHYETPHYSDSEKMEAAIRMAVAYKTDLDKIMRDYFNLFLDELRRDNEPYYSKILDNYFLSLYTLKDKKIDFTPVDKAYETAKAGLEMTKAEDYKPEGEAAEKVREAIVMYQDIIKNGETGKKGAHYLYSNLIQLQLEIGEFKEGQKSIEEMKDLGGMSKMAAKMMEGTVEDTKRKFDKAGIDYN